MTRRMACSMTVAQVNDRSKTETRRHIDTWRDLKAGDRLTLVEKAQGLKKGERQRVLTDVEVTDVRVEPLYDIDEDGCKAEGFPDLDPWEFCSMWLDAHGYASCQSQTHAVKCRVIKWRYLCECGAPLGDAHNDVDGPCCERCCEVCNGDERNEP